MTEQDIQRLEVRSPVAFLFGYPITCKPTLNLQIPARA